MVSKKIVLIGSLCLVGILYLATISRETKDHAITIGIIQTATHPALDQVQREIIQELNRYANNSVACIVQNAEGSVAQANIIASSFHSQKKVRAIVAIGSLAVQAMAHIEKEKPIIFAAVSDPESLHILHPGTNVCGTTDRINTDQQADLITQIFPQVKKIAILFNPAEKNSVAMVEKMELSLTKRGLFSQKIGVNTDGEIAHAVATAAQKHHLILIPADNLLVSAMPLVSKEALKAHCPLVASDLPSVDKGALIAQGADYTQLGKGTAKIVIEILEGASPETIGIVDPKDIKIRVNTRVQKALNIELPQNLTIEEGGNNDS